VDTRSFLESLGVPGGALWSLPTSQKRFPDGASFRLEFPSTEGPRSLQAVLEEAARLDVPVHRVSQGSGGFLLTDEELDEFAHMAARAGVEVSLFAHPIAAWTPSASARASAGFALAGASHGQEGIVAALEDIRRSAAHGIRSAVIADVGLLAAFAELRSGGLLPPDMQAKVSVTLPVANPMTARALVRLGASTLNLTTDLPLPEIAAIRAAVDVPVDIYVEAPDPNGGFFRFAELAKIIRIAAPVYVKLGLMNAPSVYGTGSHVQSTIDGLSRERVRRARLALEMLARSGEMPQTSRPGAPDLGVPRPD
jgi:hypothetical protein